VNRSWLYLSAARLGANHPLAVAGQRLQVNRPRRVNTAVLLTTCVASSRTCRVTLAANAAWAHRAPSRGRRA
jgi:hypothetical protein